MRVYRGTGVGRTLAQECDLRVYRPLEGRMGGRKTENRGSFGSDSSGGGVLSGRGMSSRHATSNGQK